MQNLWQSPRSGTGMRPQKPGSGTNWKTVAGTFLNDGPRWVTTGYLTGARQTRLLDGYRIKKSFQAGICNLPGSLVAGVTVSPGKVTEMNSRVCLPIGG